jgi:hypothetical protein
MMDTNFSLYNFSLEQRTDWLLAHALSLKVSQNRRQVAHLLKILVPPNQLLIPHQFLINPTFH